MESPFPGMDPYLEAPGLWPDVHHRLISTMAEQLQPLLASRYTAVIVPYVTLETLDIAISRLVVPDVAVIGREDSGGGGTATLTVAIAAPPLVGHVALEIPTRYSRIEIRTVAGETLVTAIELLPPANKRPGTEGVDAYERKRRELFRSDAHLLEIDLLRGGKRPDAGIDLPDEPYFVFLSRAQYRPRIFIWPMSLRAALPVVAVPLLPPDPDLPLDLTAALKRIYAIARYDLRIDYRQAPPQPELSAKDAAWMAEITTPPSQPPTA
jgi:Protein of unknown function (DUF4058)